MQHDGYISFGKRHDPEKMARGEEFEYLPFGMGGEQGPSAWRDTGPNPADEYIAAKYKADAARAFRRDARKPWWMPGMSRRRARQLQRQYDMASRLESEQ